jgi:hypothetical protein
MVKTITVNFKPILDSINNIESVLCKEFNISDDELNAVLYYSSLERWSLDKKLSSEYENQLRTYFRANEFVAHCLQKWLVQFPEPHNI